MDEIIRFGPAGNSQIFYDDGYKHSIDAPKWCAEHGLYAYEYSFGRGFTMSLDTIKTLGENARRNNVLISFHAPYYINLANPADDMAQKSFSYIIKGMEYLKSAGGLDYVVHLGTQGKLDRKDAIYLIDKRLDEVLQIIYDNNLDCCNLCPETMGKYMQVGSYKEIIDFCKKDDILVPTFDFGHINCTLQGGLKTSDDYRHILDYSIEKLGEKRVKNCHIHFSKIEYSDKGEIKHLNLDDNVYGPEFEPLAKILKEYKMTPTIISESKERMMEDAITLKKIFEKS